MWERSHQASAAASPAAIFEALSDIARWPEWHDDIEWVKAPARLATGESFALKPKGGPKVSLKITGLRSPEFYEDVTLLPLARMYFRHEISPGVGGSQIKSVIRVEGPLGFLWRRILAEKLWRELPQQTERMAAFAGARRP